MLEFAIRSLSKIKGLEPIIVMVPPRMAQNPIGITRREIARLPRRAILFTTGRNNAAAPIFCIKLEITPTTLEMIMIIYGVVNLLSFVVVIRYLVKFVDVVSPIV